MSTNQEIAERERNNMKRILMITGLLVAAVSGIYAASCTEGGLKLTGQTCGVVNGHCACSGNGN